MKQHNPIILDGKAIERFFSKIEKKSSEECWCWTGLKNTKGYGQITINSKKYIAHRVSWVLYNGAIPEGLLVCHTCDNRLCLNPMHLFLGTNKDNMRDMVEKGRSGAGEKHGNHKLTEKEVIEIREKYIPYKYTQSKLAKEYCVTQAAIYYILKYINWPHTNEETGG